MIILVMIIPSCSKTRMEEAISAEQMGRAIFEVGNIYFLSICIHVHVLFTSED